MGGAFTNMGLSIDVRVFFLCREDRADMSELSKADLEEGELEDGELDDDEPPAAPAEQPPADVPASAEPAAPNGNCKCQRRGLKM